MNFSKLEDKILYSRLKQKDRDAFIKAYDLHIDDIYRFVFFKVNQKEEAEDITSLTFLKCWDHIQSNSITDYKTLRSLFYKVAKNLIIDHYRKQSTKEITLKEDEISSLNIVDETQDLQKTIENKNDSDLIAGKLPELKDEYREVIILSYINGLSITEIAQIMDKSKGNIRVLIYRALKALKTIINNDERTRNNQ